MYQFKSSLIEFYDIKNVEQHFAKRLEISSNSNIEISRKLNKNLDDKFEKQVLTNDEWKLSRMQLIEENVFRVKSKLNHYNGFEWSQHTNKFGLLNINDCYKSFREQQSLNSDLQNKPELYTRAWIKLFEILVTFDIKDFLTNDSSESEVNCLFLCEAPGAFVTSLNHYIKQKMSTQLIFNWMASSLNPYYEENDCHQDALVEDCFVEQTLDHWYFGVDDSGDIRQPNFYRSIKQEFERKFKGSSTKIKLVTGDGGISNIQTPADQEINSFSLILNEAIVALNCLSNGVHLVKPLSSKEGNSEIYLVCLDYQLNSNVRLIERITDRLEKSKAMSTVDELNVILFKKEVIEPMFLDKLVECAILFSEHQTNTIERNIYLFEVNNRKFYFKYKKLQNKIDSLFRQLIDLTPIKIENQIVQANIQLSIKKNFHYYYGINRKALLSCDNSMSFAELMDELSNPNLKLNKICHFISSFIYLKPKNKLFNSLCKFHQFNNSTSKISCLDKFISQPNSTNVERNFRFSNTKLCCVKLIKLYDDYESLRKPIDIKFDRIEKKLEQYEEMILNQLKNLLYLKLDEITASTPFYLVNHIQNQTQHSIFFVLQKAIENLNQNYVTLTKSDEFNKTDLVLHLIDMFNLNDFDEHCLAKWLTLKLYEIIDQLKFNHTLLIVMPSLYTRYTFGLIYLCSCMFKQFTILPFYLRSNDLKSGLVIVFTNSSINRSNAEIVDHSDEFDDIEINNNMETEPNSQDIQKVFDEFDFNQEHKLVKNVIERVNYLNQTAKDERILDFIGIHRLMREKEYNNFFRLIVLANNLNIIEKMQLHMDLLSSEFM